MMYKCIIIFCLQLPNDDQSECDADLLVISELGIHEKVQCGYRTLYCSCTLPLCICSNMYMYFCAPKYVAF